MTHPGTLHSMLKPASIGSAQRADPNQFSVFPVRDTFHEDNVEYDTNCSGNRETRCNTA